MLQGLRCGVEARFQVYSATPPSSTAPSPCLCAARLYLHTSQENLPFSSPSASAVLFLQVLLLFVFIDISVWRFNKRSSGHDLGCVFICLFTFMCLSVSLPFRVVVLHSWLFVWLFLLLFACFCLACHIICIVLDLCLPLFSPPHFLSSYFCFLSLSLSISLFLSANISLPNSLSTSFPISLYLFLSLPLCSSSSPPSLSLALSCFHSCLPLLRFLLLSRCVARPSCITYDHLFTLICLRLICS